LPHLLDELFRIAGCDLVLRRAAAAVLGNLALHRTGCVVSPSKSLDLLRSSLQKLFNAEVEAIMKKHVAPFLRPAFDNVCANSSKRDGPDVVASLEQSMASVYCQLLDEVVVRHMVAHVPVCLSRSSEQSLVF